MKQSPTGKPLCSFCQKLATHRIAGFDRIEEKKMYAYQCEEHAHATSEPIPYVVTYIPVTEEKPKRFTTLVVSAPSREAVEQGFQRLQDAGISQFVSIAEAFDTTSVHSQIPFSSIQIAEDVQSSTPDETDDSDAFTETFYESDRAAARGHADYPLTLEYIRRLEWIAKAAHLWILRIKGRIFSDNFSPCCTASACKANLYNAACWTRSHITFRCGKSAVGRYPARKTDQNCHINFRLQFSFAILTTI